MKLTAIIADDEKKVCQLITHLGNWKELEIEIVDICTDGEQALNSIRRYRPDIVLTDISMPVYDGMELVRLCSREKLGCSFIIISGYRHFEYEDTLTQQGIVDYLMKPIDQELLNETLAKTVKHIHLSRLHYLSGNAGPNLPSTSSRLQIFWNMVLAQNPQSPDSLEEFNSTFHVTFVPGFFQGISLRCNMKSLHCSSSLFPEKVESCLRQALTSSFTYLYYACEERILILLNYPGQYDLTTSIINDFFYKIKNLTGLYGPFDLTIGCGAKTTYPNQLSQTIGQAITAEWARILLGGDRFIDYEDFKFPTVPSRVFLHSIDTKAITTALEDLNLEGMFSGFQKLAGHLQENEHFHPDYILPLIQKLTRSCSPFLEQNGMNPAVFERNFLMDTGELQHLQPFVLRFGTMLGEFVTHLIEEKMIKEQIPLNQAKDYIRQHFQNPLTPSLLSHLTNVDEENLTRMFLEMEHCSLEDFIHETRVEAAKNLLRSTDKKIEEIAMLTGFPNRFSFIHHFKKCTGIKPRDFQKLYS